MKLATPAAAPTTLSERLGLAVDRRPPEGALVEYRGIGDSRDLHRILELPRRPKPTVEDMKAAAEWWKARLGTPNPLCRCKVHFKRRCCENLLPVQAWALTEGMAANGILGPIGVGHGKTLLDLLMPMAISDCKVAVLLVQSSLKTQLLERDWDFYSQHWKMPNLAGGKWLVPGRPRLHVVSYSELSTAKNTDLLSRLNPDTFIVDEAHNLRARSAARTKRFLRYLNERADSSQPVRLFAWSGTLTSKSLKDYAHLSEHSLHENSPAPLDWPTVEDWAGALDAPKKTEDTFRRTPAGKLLMFCEPGEKVRDGYQRRLNDTLGVISSGDMDGCEAELNISERKVECPPKIRALIEALELTAERPDGEQLVEAMQVATVARQLSSGFYYRWRWPRRESVPVIERWLAARKAWHKELRERLKLGGVHMDSPLLLTKAALRWYNGYTHIERDENGKEVSRREVKPFTRRGPQPTWEAESWPEWKEVRDTAQPETEAVWVDDFLVKNAAEWLREGPGLCWYEFDAFGAAVARASGSLHAGPGADGNALVLGLQGDERVVASIRAHGTGKNLQCFARNLVANPPSGGDAWEQLLGRTHRQGQLADEVTVEVYRHTQSMRDAVEKARVLADYIQGTFGNVQKLVSRANWGF